MAEVTNIFDNTDQDIEKLSEDIDITKAAIIEAEFTDESLEIARRIYVLARFFYKYDFRILEDYEYTLLEDLLREIIGTWEYCTRSYDDDPIPYELLAEYGFNADDYTAQYTEDAQEVESCFDDAESKSIHSTTDWREGYKFCENHVGKRLNWSLKVDGLKTKSAYSGVGDQDLKQSQTRGRNGGTPFDVTINIKKIIPNRIKLGNQNKILVEGECVVEDNKIELVSSARGKELVQPRGSALSLLRLKSYPDDIYKYAHVYVFNISGFDSQIEALNRAKEWGFDTVPCLTEIYEHLEYAQFVERYSKVIHYIKTMGDTKHIKSDGVVVQLDSTQNFDTVGTAGMYDFGNIAFKMQEWNPDKFKAKVLKILIAQSPKGGKQFYCKALVETVKSASGSRLSVVNLFNPDIMIRNNINEGSEIEFTYGNETTIDLIY